MKKISGMLKAVLTVVLVFCTLLLVACEPNQPQETTNNTTEITTTDTNHTHASTTDSGKIDEPILTEKERYQKALKNFEKAIMVVKNNHNDIPIHYLGLYKHEFEDKESEYGFYLESFIEDYIYRIADYSLSEEEYNYATKLYENKQFARNELLTNKYLEITLSDNLENVKTASDYTVLDIYSNIILEKENVKQSEASEEFEKYYALLNEKRGEESNAFTIRMDTTWDGRDIYHICFATQSGQYYPEMTEIRIEKSLAEQIARVYNRETSQILNYVLNKDEFIIKADDVTLREVANIIKNRVQTIEQQKKEREK